MKTSEPLYKNKRRFFRFPSSLIFALSCISYQSSHSQDCPPNIDFEQGNFNGWSCYIGGTAAVNGENVITLYPSGPIPDRHTMYSANTGELDPYGGFPVSCPNGSGHSVRLGNHLPGTEAEGISYEFTIPPNLNIYSMIYHYAVVFQDPNHRPEEQPRMEIEIMNVTDNILISCSSFTFYPYGSLLPGFFLSPNPAGDTPVWCKDWSAVSINLNGMAGKTIRLFFKTADCTFRRHFGYAYIDVNSECSDEFIGAKFCPDDTAINVTAPFGYQNYTWFNNTFTQTLGTDQTIRFSPPPPVGTTLALQVVPYSGYGCLDTLFARLVDSLVVDANAGPDTISCNRNPVSLGVIPKQGLVYNWSPVNGLSNPNISNPLASPDITTTYILTTRHDGGGCVDTDTVLIRASVINDSLQLIGKAMYCLGDEDSTILMVQSADSIQWFKNNEAIYGANQPRYRATQSGSYHAMLFDKLGCVVSTRKEDVLIEKPKSGIRYPLEYAVVDLPVTLHAREFGNSAKWSPGINLDNPENYDPMFSGSSDQTYTIEIKTQAGCVTIDTQEVKVVPHVDIYVAGAFTPNNDGKNDLLRPVLMGIKELHYFRIFNRWGQLLYETKADRQGWDGNFKGGPLPTQVIVWLAEGIGVDGRTYSRKGTSVLIR